MNGSDFYHNLLLESVDTFPPYPKGCYQGKGIVLCAGGLTLLSNAYVCMKFLRKFTQLPIELFYAGSREMPAAVQHTLRDEFAPITFRDISDSEFKNSHHSFPVKHFRGWHIKPFAILSSSFEEVFYIDADNIPLQSPENLFLLPEYQSTGALFWPDLDSTRSTSEEIFRTFGVMSEKLRNDFEFETGQIVLNKRRCWKALLTVCLANSDQDGFRSFCYQNTLGDKDTFRLAFLFTESTYEMVCHPSVRIGGLFRSFSFIQNYRLDIPHETGSFFGTGMMQFDMTGAPLFVHRTVRAWSVFEKGQFLRFIESPDGTLSSSELLEEYEERGNAFLQTFKTRYLAVFGLQFYLKVQAMITNSARVFLDFIQYLKK